ncbi:MAG: HupE/UreJ family protein, partial [Aquincola sp.]|nr:HupE/UreJ family protein [Aquincola sp.]
MTHRPCRAALLGLAAAALPLIASAHVGQDGAAHHGLLAGLLHPFTGLDHLLAMLAVGTWGALSLPASGAARGGLQRLGAAARLPLVFAALLLAGALAAAAGLRLPA